MCLALTCMSQWDQASQLSCTHPLQVPVVEPVMSAAQMVGQEVLQLQLRPHSVQYRPLRQGCCSTLPMPGSRQMLSLAGALP